MINSFKLKNLQELHLNGLQINLTKPEFKKFLETIAENMPKLRLLCLTGEVEDTDVNGEWVEYAKICHEFATGKNIKLEIRDYPVLHNFIQAYPSDVVQIYSPK